MSGNSAKKSMINWHAGWLGETDANGGRLGAVFEQFKCRDCNLEKKYSNGGRQSGTTGTRVLVPGLVLAMF